MSDHKPADPGPRPSVPFWHLWTDEDGISHQNAVGDLLK